MKLTSIDLSPKATDRGVLDEQKIIIHEILQDNAFSLVEKDHNEHYHLGLHIDNAKIIFDVQTPEHTPVALHEFDLTPIKNALNDYALICESYRNAARTLSSQQVETIDMGRRGIHNQGAEELQDYLDNKITIDHPTARRLFTLINLSTNGA